MPLRFQLLSDLQDLLLPQRCALCQSGYQSACHSCLSQWRSRAREVIKIANRPVFATRHYDDLAAHIIVGAKDHHRRWLLPFLLEGIISAARPLVSSSNGSVVLVPMPSRGLSVRRRGEDLMFYIAQRAAKKFQQEGHRCMAASLLHHRRRVHDQSGLTAAQREENLKGAFEIRSQSPLLANGFDLVVIDDVLTTGASMREAARALLPWGFVGGAVATSTTF